MRTNPDIAKPALSRRAYWDIDLRTLDFDRYPEFTIIRAMERGTSNDIREIFRYYGKDKIRNIVTNSEHLLPRAQVISRRLFHLRNSDFKCSTDKLRAMNFSKF
ncbi:DUF6922 domain-containing protein [Chitinophaga sp. ARDCPP14]|uniref:DUF6922 domain-containing protein n=1 Tax=Chitinophaga sp. ARDCPP14 TaxID=3391139 RepID=UPI003F51D9EA